MGVRIHPHEASPAESARGGFCTAWYTVGMLRPLPDGIQDFEKLRITNCVYVDKTPWMTSFLTGGYTFFARPRRFGKSLMLTTLKAAFEGKKYLFEGLWLYENYDFAVKPVIHINFNQIDTKDGRLEGNFVRHLEEQAKLAGVEMETSSPANAFQSLVKNLYAKGGPVALLVDEYDKPITDYIGEEFKAQRDDHIRVLRSVYSCIKGLDLFLHTVVITGVSKFGKLSIFSDLNNIYDASMGKQHVLLCGYTKEEIEYSFPEYIQEVCIEMKITLERFWELTKYWYNGYSWDGINRVYCPYSFLIFLKRKEYKSFWYETGTPTFLIELIKKEQINLLDFEALNLEGQTLSSADVDFISPRGLMFQTGYLTIQAIDPEFDDYLLSFPNEEVRLAFSKNLLQSYIRIPDFVDSLGHKMRQGLLKRDWNLLITEMNRTLASVPYEIFPREEHYIHSLVHMMLISSGLFTQSQIQTNLGRLDTVVTYKDLVFLFEFKIKGKGTAQEALEQAKSYTEQYGDKQITCFGIVFDVENKCISDWAVE
jgi:hypothetical protein